MDAAGDCPGELSSFMEGPVEAGAAIGTAAAGAEVSML